MKVTNVLFCLFILFVTSCENDDTLPESGLLKKYTVEVYGDTETTRVFKYNSNKTISEIEIRDIPGTGDRKDIFYYNQDDKISYVETYLMESNILVGITTFEYENGLIVNQRREHSSGDFVTEILINYNNGSLTGYEVCNTADCSSGEYYNLNYSASGNNTLLEWFSRSNLRPVDRLLTTIEYEYDNSKSPLFGSNLKGQVYAYNSFYSIIPNENNVIKRDLISYSSNGSINEVFNQTIIHTYNDNNQPLVSSIYQDETLVSEIFYEYY